ncbi:hypothetical protein G6F57_023471 [Rhizopus arrhizus]|nr:hypothetical protein G6F57_023471 [Rhizopus arrhizus]
MRGAYAGSIQYVDDRRQRCQMGEMWQGATSCRHQWNAIFVTGMAQDRAAACRSPNRLLLRPGGLWAIRNASRPGCLTRRAEQGAFSIVQ